MAETARDHEELEWINEQIARIDRAIVETQKQMTERARLDVNARALNGDRREPPSLAWAGLLGGVATIVLTIAVALGWVS